MNDAVIYVQTHRFHDSVALYIRVEDINGKRHTLPTIYIPSKEARRITRAINKVAKSVETCSFKDSSPTTHVVEFDGKA